LGGVPQEHRTDTLLAVFRHLGKAAKEDLTKRDDALCQYDSMAPSRDNGGVVHENGRIEGPNGLLKITIRDALLLRGSRHFEDLAAYQAFIDELVSRRNTRNRGRIDAERVVLGALPRARRQEFEESLVRVTSQDGFTVCRDCYTVPSWLVGTSCGCACTMIGWSCLPVWCASHGAEPRVLASMAMWWMTTM